MNKILLGLLAAIALLTNVITVYGATFDFQNGPTKLTFDDQTGGLTAISFAGREVARCASGAFDFTFAIGPAPDKITWAEQLGDKRRLIRHISPEKGVVDVTVALGDYEWTQRFVLHGDTPRIDRSATLVNHGKETVKLRGAAFLLSGVMANGEGFYRMPMSWPPESHAFAEMKPGRKTSGRGAIAPALAQISPTQTLMWASLGEDRANIRFTERQGAFDVHQGFASCGYLRPEQPQKFGFVSMQLQDGGYWTALPKLWDWMDSVGLKVPADRPEWVRQAVLYSFHPGGTIGSGFRDLGGFGPAMEKLLPTIPGLGATAIWIMPIEYKSPYWPLDYYRFMDGLGTGEQYKQLVAKAHAMKLHVLQDLVPHGGSPKAKHNIEHPEFMLHREDGSTLDYWLNDFARRDWQHYIADVAGYYVSNYGVDGYRIDAISGSKEPNWDPNIPYARASLAELTGGLQMLRGIRERVRQLKPRDGAVLAEVESSRHEAEADMVYDFRLCYDILPQWRQMEAPKFVAALQEYLEEQKFSEPRGALRLRHIESHDALRSQLWYGVRGMRAMYALSAWIDGVPLMYHGIEVGSSSELAQINQTRAARPELTAGEAKYRSVTCDAPGVFTCLRTLGHRSSAIAINFNDHAIKAKLAWDGNEANVELNPLDYVCLPQGSTAPAPAPAMANKGASQQTTLQGAVDFYNATDWFVDTIEGRIHDRYAGSRESGQLTRFSSIYWRPQGTGTLWDSATAPLHPASRRVGYRNTAGKWKIFQFDATNPVGMRLVERVDDRPGLRLIVDGAAGAQIVEGDEPAEVDATEPVTLGDVNLRCVGSDYIISNRRYAIRLHRQGGTIARLCDAHGAVLVEGQDFYGDQAYFANNKREVSRITASDDVECGVTLREEKDSLHLVFEGQFRGAQRFAIRRPALLYRNEFVFGAGPSFQQTWAFRDNQGFKDQKAFLTMWLPKIEADRMRCLRGGRVLEDEPITEGKSRHGQLRGERLPDSVEFLSGERRRFALTDLHLPAEPGVSVFLTGRLFFAPLLDGATSTMDREVWYEFGATWRVGE